jgi:hypothetical protein
MLISRTEKSIVRLGYQNETTANYIWPQDTDALCPILHCAAQIAPTGDFTSWIASILASGGGFLIGEDVLSL